VLLFFVPHRCCLLHSCGGWWISSVEHYIHAYYIVQVRGRVPFHFRVSVLSNQVCGACSHASWPTGRRGPGLNSFTCKRVSASATQPKPIQPMDAPTTVPIPIPHAHMTSPLHCSYLDPCLPKCQTETVLFHLFHCLVQATETLCVWWSFHASGSGWGSEVVTDILTPRFS